MENKKDILVRVKEANESRELTRLTRRIAKAAEELGELAEAQLSVTTVKNSKKKTWKHVREEAVDLAIVALDVALTPFPTDTPDLDITADIEKILSKKLAKWLKNKGTGQVELIELSLPEPIKTSKKPRGKPKAKN